MAKMLSIIIPALNEEAFLPRLLDSIKSQNLKDYEIIVADAGSKDKTAEIAKKYGCKVVKGGKPAEGRNNGAKAAKGDILLFLDADIVLLSKFIQKCMAEFSSRKLDCATCCLKSDSKGIINYALLQIWAGLMILLQHCKPHATGACILIKKKWHNMVGGFNEQLFQGEDHDYACKIARRKGRFGVLRSAKAMVSMRRFNKEGRFKMILKYSYVFFYRIFKGEIKKPAFRYFENK